jgi:hypothetical protein
MGRVSPSQREAVERLFLRLFFIISFSLYTTHSLAHSTLPICSPFVSVNNRRLMPHYRVSHRYQSHGKMHMYYYVIWVVHLYLLHGVAATLRIAMVLVHS